VEERVVESVPTLFRSDYGNRNTVDDRPLPNVFLESTGAKVFSDCFHHDVWISVQFLCAFSECLLSSKFLGIIGRATRLNDSLASIFVWPRSHSSTPLFYSNYDITRPAGI
jgi:hypothetical protein